MTGSTGPYGPIAVVAVTKTANYSPAVSELVPFDPTGGTFTITLPTAVGAGGKSIVIKNVSLSTTAISVATTGGQTIDALAAPQSFSGSKRAWTFTSDGANWLITSSYTV